MYTRSVKVKCPFMSRLVTLVKRNIEILFTLHLLMNNKVQKTKSFFSKFVEIWISIKNYFQSLYILELYMINWKSKIHYSNSAAQTYKVNNLMKCTSSLLIEAFVKHFIKLSIVILTVKDMSLIFFFVSFISFPITSSM